MDIIRQWMDEAEQTDDIEIMEVSHFVEDGVQYRSLYLNMELMKGKFVKVFTWLGIPAGSINYPAILHIHGGSQTANLEQVKHWARQGYVACSYDWSGPIHNREVFSDLSSMPTQDPMAEYDPRLSVMLTRVLLAKRMVSWFLEVKEVNPVLCNIYRG